MNRFRTGNVVKLQDNKVVIVTEVLSDHIIAIPINFTNSSIHLNHKITEHSFICGCTYGDDDGNPDSECEICHGSGERNVINKGTVGSKILADTVKEYIIENLTKNFEF